MSKRLLLTLMLAWSWSPRPVAVEAAAPAAPAPGKKTARSRPASKPDPKATATGIPAAIRKRLKSNQATKRNIGSATVLTGNVCLIHLFLSDKGSSWTPKEKAEMLARTDTAVAFLRKQAKRYKKDFTACREVLPEVAMDETIPAKLFVNPGWIARAIGKAGYQSAPELVRKLRARHKADHAVIVVHVDKRCTSYNLSYYRNVRREFFAERVVMFTRYADGRPTCAASYAHEILHSFGAGELYFPFDVSSFRKNRARKYFPNEIMFRVDYKIERLNVGDYTAYRVGWIDKLDEKYKLFEDAG